MPSDIYFGGDFAHLYNRAFPPMMEVVERRESYCSSFSEVGSLSLNDDGIRSIRRLSSGSDEFAALTLTHPKSLPNEDLQSPESSKCHRRREQNRTAYVLTDFLYSVWRPAAD